MIESDKAVMQQALEALVNSSEFVFEDISKAPLREQAMQALCAAIAQPVQPTHSIWQPTETAITALKRFEETCTDNEGYDVPKDTMRNLAAIGLIYRTYGDMYCITDFGQHILGNAIAQLTQPASTK